MTSTKRNRNRNDNELLLQGEEHYKKGAIQPIEYILANDMGFCEGNVIKYITRYKYSSNPKRDLEKIKHYVDFLLEEAHDR